MGGLSLACNFDQVLEAARLLSSNKRARFVIQGGGELGPETESKVKKMGLSNVAVKIVDRSRISGLLNSIDILLLPLSGLGSVEMGISSKLYEYLAAGKPAICCSSVQPARFASETESGVVVKPSNSKDMVKAILYLYNNRDLANRLGEAGKRYAENNISLERIALRAEKIFSIASKHA